jgi:hypothetical protein
MSSPSVKDSRISSLLLHNGKIWTGLDSPQVQAIVILDGIIIATGDDQDILNTYGTQYHEKVNQHQSTQHMQATSIRVDAWCMLISSAHLGLGMYMVDQPEWCNSDSRSNGQSFTRYS